MQGRGRKRPHCGTADISSGCCSGCRDQPAGSGRPQTREHGKRALPAILGINSLTRECGSRQRARTGCNSEATGTPLAFDSKLAAERARSAPAGVRASPLLGCSVEYARSPVAKGPPPSEACPMRDAKHQRHTRAARVWRGPHVRATARHAVCRPGGPLRAVPLVSQSTKETQPRACEDQGGRDCIVGCVEPLVALASPHRHSPGLERQDLHSYTHTRRQQTAAALAAARLG